MLTVEQVKCMVAGKGSKIATVTFLKADGSTRVVNGLFKPTSKMVGSDRGLAQGEAMKARGQVPIWSLQEKSWKSFMLDKVMEIK
jgi:hypothetical protein